ncbi:MAG: hypothetical protein ACTSQY_11710 [Candidatus Odinarchaeia archaeon]
MSQKELSGGLRALFIASGIIAIIFALIVIIFPTFGFYFSVIFLLISLAFNGIVGIVGGLVYSQANPYARGASAGGGFLILFLVMFGIFIPGFIEFFAIFFLGISLMISGFMYIALAATNTEISTVLRVLLVIVAVIIIILAFFVMVYPYFGAVMLVIITAINLMILGAMNIVIGAKGENPYGPRQEAYI